MNAVKKETTLVKNTKGKRPVFRRTYLIDKKLQFGFAGNLLLIVVLSVVFTALFSGWFVLHVLDDRLICVSNGVFWTRLAMIFLFIVVGVVLWSVKRSHSLAGPVYRTRMVLKDAARGVFPDRPVRFRKGDAFRELADDMNLCLDIMKAAKVENVPECDDQ